MYVIQLVEGESGVCKVMAFADTTALAERLVEKCALLYIERQNGQERVQHAYETPSGEGLYLVKEDDLHLVLHRKSVKVTEAGWFLSESVSWKQAKVGDIRACEFQINALDAETAYVLPTETLVGDLTTVPRTLRMAREERPQPWLHELKGHPRFFYKND